MNEEWRCTEHEGDIKDHSHLDISDLSISKLKICH